MRVQDIEADSTFAGHEVEEPAAVKLEGVWKQYRRGRTGETVPIPIGGGSRPDRRDDTEDDDELDEGLDEIVEDPDEIDERPAGPTVALQDVSFEVGVGRAVGLIGPNGAGKTTLLRLVGRLTPPTKGRILVRGRVAPLLGLATALMHPDLSGRQNVLVVAELFGVPRDVTERRLPAIMAFAGLEGRENKPVKTYSSGVYRRLAFSVALNLEPDILLVDEIIGVGDSAFARQCFIAVQEASKHGLTILYASHDMAAIADLCDEVIWMDEGRVVHRGQPDDTIARYERSYSRPGDRRSASSRRYLLDPRLAKSGRHESEHVALLSAGLYALDGEPIGDLNAQDGAVVELVLETLTPNIVIRCVVAFTVEGADRLKAIQQETRKAEQTGIYIVTLHIPSGTLRDGLHETRVGARVFDGTRWTAVTGRGLFSFDVHDSPDTSDYEFVADETVTPLEDQVILDGSADLDWLVSQAPVSPDSRHDETGQ